MTCYYFYIHISCYWLIYCYSVSCSCTLSYCWSTSKNYIDNFIICFSSWSCIIRDNSFNWSCVYIYCFEASTSYYTWKSYIISFTTFCVRVICIIYCEVYWSISFQNCNCNCFWSDISIFSCIVSDNNIYIHICKSYFT